MNKIKLCILYNSKFTNFLIYNNYELYKKLIKYYGNIELVNIDGYGKKNSNKFKKQFRYRDLSFKKYTPHNKINIKNIFKNEKFIVIDYLDNSFKSMNIYYHLKLNNIHFIKINNIADLGTEFDSHFNKFSFKYNLVDLKKKFLKFFIKFLRRINFFNKISIDFQCENKAYNKSLIVSFLDFFNFKHTIKKVLINNRDLEFNKYKIINKKKNILLIDSPIDHPDNVAREGNTSIKRKRLYHKTLINYLCELEDKYKKKIYIAIHPKSNLKKLKSIYKKFKIFQFKTPELVLNSEIILFYDSSAIIPALLLKKKIINIQTKLMGNWMYFRSKIYPKHVDLVSYNLENKKYFFKNKKITKSKLSKYLLKAKDNYKDYFIQKKTNFSKNSAEKIIIKEIDKLYF